tara:strand:- start:171 stop:365 length:195 start_codon:yes stop_codon:yes gene_type:complete
MNEYYKMYKTTEKITAETNKEIFALKKDNTNLTKQLYETLKRIKELKEKITYLEKIINNSIGLE